MVLRRNWADKLDWSYRDASLETFSYLFFGWRMIMRTPSHRCWQHIVFVLVCPRKDLRPFRLRVPFFFSPLLNFAGSQSKLRASLLKNAEMGERFGRKTHVTAYANVPFPYT